MWSWISVALAGYVSIYSFKKNDKKQSLIFKVVALGLLCLLLITHSSTVSASGLWIFASLMVSIVADWLHCFRPYSKVSFCSFLVAQLMVSKAFWLQLSGTIVWWMPALLIATGIVAFFLLLPQLDKLIFPVMVMGLVLLQMAWAAGEAWLKIGTTPSLFGFLGSIAFIISWLTVAIHERRQEIKGAVYLISGFYFLAQCFVVQAVLIVN